MSKYYEVDPTEEQELAESLATYDLQQVDGNCALYDAEVICLQDPDHRVAYTNIGKFVEEISEENDTVLVEASPQVSIRHYALPPHNIVSWENQADYLLAGLVEDRRERVEEKAEAQETLELALQPASLATGAAGVSTVTKADRLYTALERLDIYWDYISLDKRNEALIANLHRTVKDRRQKTFLIAGASHFTEPVREALGQYAFVRLAPFPAKPIDAALAAHFNETRTSSERKELKARWLAARAIQQRNQ